MHEKCVEMDETRVCTHYPCEIDHIWRKTSQDPIELNSVQNLLSGFIVDVFHRIRQRKRFPHDGSDAGAQSIGELQMNERNIGNARYIGNV